MLFKIAAITEAVGWSMLISGIVISTYITPGNEIAVQMAGRIHGTLFLIYVTAVLTLSPSLGFTLPKTIVAGLCSAPPYGSLIFEIWFTSDRDITAILRLKNIIAYRSLINE